MIHINKTNIRRIDINKNNNFHLLHTYLEASCSPPSDRDVRIESISSRNMVEGA